MATPHFSDDKITRLLATHGPQRPPAFAMLHPQADLIRALRQKGASHETVRQILKERGVHVAKTSIRNFCLKVLGEERASRGGSRRKAPRMTPPAPLPAAPPVVPLAVRPPARGPRIANLKRQEGDGV